MSLIEADGLTKIYRVAVRRPGAFGAIRSVVNPHIRQVEAVRDLSLRVERGEMVALIGPNGAGKSTTIKMLTGILMPSAGRVRVAGLDPQHDRRALAGQMGVVFGQRTQLWWDLPLIESLRLLRHLYQVPAERHAATLAHLTETLDLGDFLDTPVRQLSLGQRMRGDLAAALLHQPKLVYLDEPTIGLDVVAKARIREFLRTEHHERGLTVMLTTHDMDDIEALCERMVIVDHGRKLYDGALTAIRDELGGERRLIAVLDDAELVRLPVDATGKPDVLDLPPGVRVAAVEPPRLSLAFTRDSLPGHELVAWLGARYRLRDVTFEEPEIEDVIRRIYEEGLLTTAV